MTPLFRMLREPWGYAPRDPVSATIASIVDAVSSFAAAAAPEVTADAALGAAGAGGGEAAATASFGGALTGSGGVAAADTAGAALGGTLEDIAAVGGGGPGAAAADAAGSGGFLPASADAAATEAAPISSAPIAPAGGSAGSSGAGASAAGASAAGSAAPSPSAVIGAMQGSETNLPAAAAVGDYTSGANSILEVPASASSDSSPGFFSSLFGGGDTPASALGSSGAGSGAASGGAAGGGSPGLLSTIKSYGPLALGLGGLGYNVFNSLTAPKDSSLSGTTSALAAEAANAKTQGQQLQSYLTSGTLPAGAQNAINSALQSATETVQSQIASQKAAIRSRYAQMGGNTSAMEQDLANVDQQASNQISNLQSQAASQGASIATNLLNAGVSETGLSSQIYAQLMQSATAQNTALSNSITSLASAAAGVPKIFQVNG